MASGGQADVTQRGPVESAVKKRGRPAKSPFPAGDGHAQVLKFMREALPSVPPVVRIYQGLLHPWPRTSGLQAITKLRQAVLADAQYLRERHLCLRALCAQVQMPLADVPGAADAVNLGSLVHQWVQGTLSVACVACTLAAVVGPNAEAAVHDGLPGFEDAAAAPIGAGYAFNIMHRRDGESCHRIVTAVMSLLHMCSLHDLVLSPKASKGSRMHMTLPLMFRADGTEAIQAAVFDGLLAKPECGYSMDSNYNKVQNGTNPVAEHGNSSYHAALAATLHQQRVSLSSTDQDDKCGVTTARNLIRCAYKLLLVGCMAYTPRHLWQMVWGCAEFAGNVHASKWLERRARSVGLGAQDIGYTDCPALSVGATLAGGRPVNAAELDSWLYQSALSSLVEEKLLHRRGGRYYSCQEGEPVIEICRAKDLAHKIKIIKPGCQWALCRTELRARLSEAHRGWLSAVHKNTVLVSDSDGQPWVSVQYCSVDESQAIPVSTSTDVVAEYWNKSLEFPCPNPLFQLPYVVVHVAHTQTNARRNLGAVRGVVAYHSIQLGGERRALLAFHKTVSQGDGHFPGLGGATWYAPPNTHGFYMAAQEALADMAAGNVVLLQETTGERLSSCTLLSGNISLGTLATRHLNPPRTPPRAHSPVPRETPLTTYRNKCLVTSSS